MTRNQAIAFGAVGLAAGGILLTVLGQGGRGSASKGSGKGTGQPGPKPAPAPSPGGTPDPNLAQRYPGLVMIDMRAKAPKERIDYIRGLDKTTAAVIHQTGFFGWKDTNPLWPEIKAHFVVRQAGQRPAAARRWLHGPSRLRRRHRHERGGRQGLRLEPWQQR